MSSVIHIDGLNKTYASGFAALHNINLEIKEGEIFALLGPNGAGKTTLINSVCGIVQPSTGKISVCGYDIVEDYRATRSCIGLVPQELTTDAFETVWNTVCFSRGVFGKPQAPDLIESILKKLSLWDKKDNQVRTLSGGMKRRLMIAKALSHEPRVLFLDEPTAGVDVELRKSMWKLVSELRDTGVTIILTTHYIEEAEEMADRIGIIRKGEIILVEEKASLIKKLGRKELSIELHHPLEAVPEDLSAFDITLSEDRYHIAYAYDSLQEDNGVISLLEKLKAHQIECKDFHTSQSSLEDIFIELVGVK